MTCVPLGKILNPNNGLRSYSQFHEAVRLAINYRLPLDHVVKNVVVSLQTQISDSGTDSKTTKPLTYLLWWCYVCKRDPTSITPVGCTQTDSRIPEAGYKRGCISCREVRWACHRLHHRQPQSEPAVLLAVRQARWLQCHSSTSTGWHTCLVPFFLTQNILSASATTGSMRNARESGLKDIDWLIRLCVCVYVYVCV